MTKISEQLRISAAEDVSTLCRPTSPLPTTPTPRTQLAQAVGAAMVQALNGRIQQHKLQQYQYPSPDGSYGRGNESRVREVREVQSLA
jgi:hypothetical protein